MEDKELILGQYKVYSEAKENFIDRHFATNRFYFVFAFALLTATYVFYALSPGLIPLIVTAAFGIAVSILWWLNIDSYQVLIKIKYSKVLEYLETKLPESPYNKEFQETKKLNRAKNLTFPDVQKGFAGLLFFVFLIIFIMSIAGALNFKNAVWF
ncbi:MAG: hypothetical protein LUE64_03265 [Candidatus Gastranaerophilales bacterium]|nr:hypothetical protein [Candidatus Gastranaerophilales bacterium]